ncbi:MAG TPA: formyltransferase family protein [Patescibacteria group bacterium]|nr:formyltransferase family protein [Patescibacteria group bacterium]
MTIWHKIKNKIFYLSAVYLRPSYLVVIWRDYRNKFETIYADVDHLNAAIRWLVQAHNRTSLGVVSDGGIFKSEIIVATKLGILNNHLGLLPDFRGMNVLEWSLFYNRQIGVSTHFINRGIDTGDTLCFNSINIEVGDNIASLRAKAQPIYVSAIIECVSKLVSGELIRNPQQPEDGKQYFVMHPRLKQIVENKLNKNEAPKMKVLCLSFWTPPLVRPRAILIGKMIPQWICQGLESIIVAYEGDDSWQPDAQVYKIKPFTLDSWARKSAIMRNIYEFLYYQKLYFQVKKIISRHQPDVVFSFSNPQASNILGAMIKSRLKLPFISHFSDPWYDNPYKKYTGLGAKKVLWLEKYIVKNSDRIVFTNDQAKDLIMKKHPREYYDRAVTIPHCYNESEYPSVNKHNDKFIISHIGAFYPDRNPEPLLQAISQQPEIQSKIKIKFIGCSSDYVGYSIDDVKNLARKYNLENIVEIIPPISYEQSLKEMKLSDLLVSIDANFKVSPFLPSKLIDYAGSDTPVVGISPTGSPTDWFLSSLGLCCFSYDQIDGLGEYISNLIDKKIEIKVNKEFLDQFKVENTTKKLIQYFSNIIK